MRHPDCNYDAGLIKGIWFCNKCGWMSGVVPGRRLPPGKNLQAKSL